MSLSFIALMRDQSVLDVFEENDLFILLFLGNRCYAARFVCGHGLILARVLASASLARSVS